MTPSSTEMPVLFVGHGSPLNAIEDNQFSRGWGKMGSRIPPPRAILSISAHWYIDETRLLSAEHPRTIHDFWGFPEELYQVQYPAPGSPSTAELTSKLIKTQPADLDDSWGLDHGTWTVLTHMYPKGNVPVSQLSVNYRLPNEMHFKIGKELKRLRNQGVLIMGSGNLVHNLGMISWHHREAGFPWAEEFDEVLKSLIIAREDEKLIQYIRLGKFARLSIPTPDHYWPLLYVLGASEPSEPIEIFNDECVFGSVSMTCVTIGSTG